MLTSTVLLLSAFTGLTIGEECSDNASDTVCTDSAVDPEHSNDTFNQPPWEALGKANQEKWGFVKLDKNIVSHIYENWEDYIDYLWNLEINHVSYPGRSEQEIERQKLNHDSLSQITDYFDYEMGQSAELIDFNDVINKATQLNHQKVLDSLNDAESRLSSLFSSETDRTTKVLVCHAGQYMPYYFYRQFNAIRSNYGQYDTIALQLLHKSVQTSILSSDGIDNSDEIGDFADTADAVEFYDINEASDMGLTNLFLHGRSTFQNLTLINQDIIIFPKYSPFMTDSKSNLLRIYLLSLVNTNSTHNITAPQTAQTAQTAQTPKTTQTTTTETGHVRDYKLRVYKYFGMPMFNFNLENAELTLLKNVSFDGLSDPTRRIVDFAKVANCSNQVRLSNTATYRYGRSNKGGWQSNVNVFADIDILPFDESCKDEFRLFYYVYVEHLLRWYFSYQAGQLAIYLEHDEGLERVSSRMIIVNGGKYLQSADIHSSAKNTRTINDANLRKRFYFVKMDVKHAWLNINAGTQMNGPHQHGFGALSSVTYFTTLTGDKNGAIHFRDAREWTQANEDLRLMPYTGTMVLFPGWLTHWVEPTYSNELRASIAVNVDPTEEMVESEEFEDNGVTEEMLNGDDVWFRIKII